MDLNKGKKDFNLKNEIILGIDLGTSNSQAAFVKDGKVIIVNSEEGNTIYGKAFPSVVSFTDSNEILVGQPAKNNYSENPDSTIFEVKKKMGTTFQYKIKNKIYSPQQISGYILKKIKKDSEKLLNKKIKYAIITVPANFTDAQRRATKEAGYLADLEVLRLINEPTSAALAYGIDKQNEGRTMVLDLGGGTFDVTILDIVSGTLEVISTAGDLKLGGTYFDEELAKYLRKNFEEKNDVSLENNALALERIKKSAESSKIELSSKSESSIIIPYLFLKNNKSLTLKQKINRTTLESLIKKYLDRLQKPILNTLNEAKLQPSQIKNIILVGGPTKMPCIKRIFKEILNKDASESVDPMQCVATGAALQGAILSGNIKGVLLLDVTPLSLGIQTGDGLMSIIIKKNTTIPVRRKETFTTYSDNQESVDIRVLQGERPIAKDNQELDLFRLSNIEPGKRGDPKIEVSFDIDADGILKVSAVDLKTKSKNEITVASKTHLNKEDIERIKEEAKKHEEADLKKKNLIIEKSTSKNILYRITNLKIDFEKFIEKEDLEIIKGFEKTISESLIKNVIEEIKENNEKINKELIKITVKCHNKKRSESKSEEKKPEIPKK